MSVVTMKQLLEAGVHFGHQTRRWNPKMAEYIYCERNGIYIIDLQKTVKKLEEAYDFVRELAKNDQTVLFVGTKKQAADAIREEAARVGMYYVNARWLGGMLTNFKTALFVVDPRKEHNAIAEARKLHIPIVAIVDTNCDPDEVDYVIPANDDAIRAIRLIAATMANAVQEGRQGEDAAVDFAAAVAEEAPEEAKDEAEAE